MVKRNKSATFLTSLIGVMIKGMFGEKTHHGVTRKGVFGEKTRHTS